MGCGGSKVDDLPLVTLCRERKQLIRAAAEHRYALSAAHLSYFHSLKDVGDALRRFVEEELVIPSTSAPSSPVLTLPSEGKGTKVKHRSTDLHSHSHGHGHGHGHVHGRNGGDGSNKKSTSSSGSISLVHSLDHDHGDVDNEDSHLPLSSDSDSDSDSESSHIHLHADDYDRGGHQTRAPPPSYSARPTEWEDPYRMNPPPYQPDWNSYPIDPQPPPYQQEWGAYGLNPPYQTSWGPYVGTSEPYGYNNVGNSDPFGYGGASNTRAYFMRKSAPAVRTVIQQREQRMFQGGEQRMDYTNSSAYSGYLNEGGGFFGFPMGTPRREVSERNQPSPAGPPPPPPPPPPASGWDFLNPFDGYDHSYPGYYTDNKYGYSSIASSPNSDEVREREGIPDLEEETESEAFHREIGKKNKLNMNRNSGEGTSRAVPQRNTVDTEPSQSSEEGSRRGMRAGTSETTFKQNKLNVKRKNFGEGTPRAVPQKNAEDTEPSFSSEEGSRRGMHAGASETETTNKSAHWQNSEEGTWHNDKDEAAQQDNLNEEKSSPDTIVSIGMEEGHNRKKGVSFEIDEASMPDADSSKLSSLTTLSAHGTRDLQEVVNEIRDDFEIASGYGKEVALMLEAGKLPYQPKFGALKVILSRILYQVAPSSSSSRSLMRSMRLRSRVLKLARAYQLDSGSDENFRSRHLSSTLEKLYEWEKKLYREVKDEERLRVSYEKMCNRLKELDDRGAESSKIDATHASIRRLLTKLNVCIKAIDGISSRIQKLRDEELQPQISQLIHGLIEMWKSMLKCHQKQFQAILDSKSRTLRANTGFGRDSSISASRALEHGLETWCAHFNVWINAQKLYIKSLQGWLVRCLHYEPEDTADGLVPFSPGRLGAPPIFVICNDWHQGMNSVSEEDVSNAMLTFASNLRQLWERQDEEQRQRIRADYIVKDYEKRRKALRTEKGKLGHHHDQDAMSDKTAGSIVASDSGVSPLDDLKVDLDSLRHKMNEEKAKHKDTIKLVDDAASTSLQGGIIPIFKALEKFTSDTLKAHEQVRLS